MSLGLVEVRRIMLRAASTEMVMTSSSGPGTDLLNIMRPLLMASPSLPHTLPISGGTMRKRGMYAP